MNGRSVPGSRKSNRDRCANTNLALDIEQAAVQVDEGLDDGEAEAFALLGNQWVSFCPHEGVCQGWDFFG